MCLESRELDFGRKTARQRFRNYAAHGIFEVALCSYYADKPDKETREGLTNYVKSQYIAEKLVSAEAD